MAKFTVTIEMILSRDFEVEAEDWTEAMDIAEKNYNNGRCDFRTDFTARNQMAITSPEDEVTEWVEF